MKWARVVLTFTGFVLLGAGSGANGVLLPSQITDYQVDKVTIGLTFFTFSAGYLLTGVANGALIRWLGIRGYLCAGTAIYAFTSCGIALRPPFPVFVAATFLLGLGTGALDAGFNAFISTLPGHTALLNFMHAFFGVGALIGPVLASQLLGQGLPWQDVYWLLAAFAVPIMAGGALLLPRRSPPGPTEPGAPLMLALRRPEVWLAATFLCLYVGVEVSVGNWGFSYLTEYHGQTDQFAGYVVSGYWLGLTLGRFVLNATASRAGVSLTVMIYICLAGVCAATLVIWWAPGAALPTLGFALVGFFLGPLFPTTVAVMPQLAPARLVPTAIGLLVGGSVIGGAVFPYVAGALAQDIGLGTLLPYLLVLVVLLTVGWWSIARRLPHRSDGSVASAGPAFPLDGSVAGGLTAGESRVQPAASSEIAAATDAGSAPRPTASPNR